MSIREQMALTIRNSMKLAKPLTDSAVKNRRRSGVKAARITSNSVYYYFAPLLLWGNHPLYALRCRRAMVHALGSDTQVLLRLDAVHSVKTQAIFAVQGEKTRKMHRIL